jgi:hypothetical protein
MFKNRKFLATALAVVLVLSLGASAAFAAWPSFQNTNTNNGVVAVQPPITAPTTTAVQLPGVVGTTYSGVDAEPVVYTATYTDSTGATSQKSIAYALYDGNTTSGTDGGARVAAVDLVAATTLWSLRLKDTTNFQVSTPYIDTAANKLYAGITYDTELYNYTNFLGWETIADATIDPTTGVATFPAGKKSGIKSTLILTQPVSTLYVPTNITVPAGGAADQYYVALIDQAGTKEYNLSAGSLSANTSGTYVTYNGEQIPAGTYTVAIVIPNTGTADITASTLSLTRYDWELYSVSAINTAAPYKSAALANGEGQFNTPISYDGSSIYWGIWGGTKSYYQYNKSTAALTTFTPNGTAGDNFYGAGAYSDGTYVYFGSDSGTVYIQNAAAFATTVKTLSVTSTATAGQIRSTIAYDAAGGNMYFTSKGTGSAGYLWQITGAGTDAALSAPITLSNNSTSTPVISANDYIYVGYSNGFSAGGVEAVRARTFSGTPIPIYTGDPVQASPIVYSGVDPETNDDIDYVYFTTNSGTGKGYCYPYDVSTVTVLTPWNAGGTSANPYALQGFAASDDGYLVYGDDGNYLYIMHQ